VDMMRRLERIELAIPVSLEECGEVQSNLVSASNPLVAVESLTSDVAPSHFGLLQSHASQANRGKDFLRFMEVCSGNADLTE